MNKKREAYEIMLYILDLGLNKRQMAQLLFVHHSLIYYFIGREEVTNEDVADILISWRDASLAPIRAYLYINELDRHRMIRKVRDLVEKGISYADISVRLERYEGYISAVMTNKMRMRYKEFDRLMSFEEDDL